VLEERAKSHIFLGLEVSSVAQFFLCNPKLPVFSNIVSGRSAMTDRKLQGIAQGILCRLFDQSDSITWFCFRQVLVMERLMGLYSNGFPKKVLENAVRSSKLPGIDMKFIMSGL
jgi:hypothetical protein